MTTIANLENLGISEIEEASNIMLAYAKDSTTQGFKNMFWRQGVTVGFNNFSGFVFLKNDDYQAALLNDDKELYMFYNLAYDGTEGSAGELYDMFKDGVINEEDYEQLADILANDMYEVSDPDAETKVRAAIEQME